MAAKKRSKKALKKKVTKKSASRSSRVLMVFREHKPLFSPSTGEPFMTNFGEAERVREFYQGQYPTESVVIVDTSKAHAIKSRVKKLPRLEFPE